MWALPTIEDVLKKHDPDLVAHMGFPFDEAWLRGDLSDAELVYYLTCDKMVRSQMRWQPVGGEWPPRAPRARLDVPVHCSDRCGRTLRLRANVYRTGFSVSLFYPARPKDIRLAGLDAAPGRDLRGNEIPGPHTQLCVVEGQHIDTHTRIASCEDGPVPVTPGEADVGILQFARVLSIRLTHRLQTSMHELTR